VRRSVAEAARQFDSEVVQSFLPFAQADMANVFAAAGTAVTSAL